MAGIIRFFARIFVLKVVVHRLRNDRHPARPARTTSSPATRQSAPRPTAAKEDEGLSPPSGRGGSPASPLDLEGADWKATAKRTLKEIKDDRVPLIAAGMAFYFFLAIFPALIAFIGIMGLVDIDVAGIIEAIQRNMPGGSGEVLVDAVRSAENPSEGASFFAAIFGIATALWSSSSGMVALQQGLNVAYDIPQDRKFIGKRGLALVLIVLTGLLGGVPSPFFTFGDGAIFSLVGWTLTAIAVMVLFAVYYFLGPYREDRSWRWVTPGGALGAVLWIVASLGFGYYAGNFGSYPETYGPLAGVIVLIFWLYLSSLAVLVGGELNAEVERQGNRVASRRG